MRRLVSAEDRSARVEGVRLPRPHVAAPRGITRWTGIVARLRPVIDGDHGLLLSDYDGTLTPIVNHPSDAWLAPRVRADLARLAQCPRLLVGVVSGRGSKTCGDPSGCQA